MDLNKHSFRWKCASCGHVFDGDGYIECPKCGSNACDEVAK